LIFISYICRYFPKLEFNFLVIIMKKLFLTAALALVGVGAFAQEVANFYPAWFYEIKAGGSYTAGETTVGKLTSHVGEFNAGYQFTPTFGLRGGLMGGKAKGIIENTQDMYSWRYAQFNVDAMIDLLNLFAKNKRSDRAVNPYVYGGIGANLRFDNAEALALKEAFDAVFNRHYLWEGARVSPCARVGIGMGIRLSDAVAIVLEVEDNFYTDKFNSKVGPANVDFDFLIAAQTGVKFTFGAAKKKANAMAVAAAALAAQEAEAAAKAAAEKAAAEAAARAAAEKAAAAAEKAAAESASAAAARANARQSTNNIYFAIGRNDVREVENAKVAKIVSLLKTYPEAVVTVSGYADKATGSPKLNMQLSKKRAETVAKALEDAGIAKSRITVEYYGDTVQPYASQVENRVSVCVTR